MFPIRDEESSGIFPFINIALIALTAYIFYLQLIEVDPEAFVLRYALIPSKINFSDLSSLFPFISSMFLHGGWLHFLGNMWFLWIFGDNVEGAFGHVRYLFFYLFCGIVSGLVQYFFAPYIDIPTLGASGAIAGVLGAYMSLFPDHKIDTLLFLIFISRVEIAARYMLLYWFIIQLFSGVGSLGYADAGGVAWWAHVGGFAAGWILSKPFVGQIE
jgi:membrane associated rhomboid family serine protease